MSKKKKIILSSTLVVGIVLAITIIASTELFGKIFYRPSQYYVRFVADQVVDTQYYTVNDKNIDEPQVPAKVGYDGRWEDYSLDNTNVTVNAVYTPTPYKLTFTAGNGVVAQFTVDCENLDFTEPQVPEFLDFDGSWEDYSLENLSSDIVVKALYTSKGATDGIKYEYDEINGCYVVVGYVGEESIINIPDFYKSQRVQFIGKDAFADSAIVKVTIPKNIKSIDTTAFINCEKLVEVSNNSALNIVKGSSDNGAVAQNAISVINGNAEETNLTYKDGFVFVADGENNYLVDYPKNLTEVVLPTAQSYSIYKGLFKDSSISKITFSQSVNGVMEEAFYGCKNLEIVNFDNANQLSVIGEKAFYGCGRISLLYLPKNLTEIGSNAFYGCLNLAKVSTPGSLSASKIGLYAFSNCTNLVEWEYSSATSPTSAMPSSVLHAYPSGGTSYITVTQDGFVIYADINTCLLVSNLYADDVTTSLTLPAYNRSYQVTAYALKGYEAVTEIIAPQNADLSTGSLYGFNSVTKLTVYNMGSKLATLFDVYGSDNVNNVPSSFNEIVIQGGEICDQAFLNCQSLTSATVENGTLTIPSYAFYGCSSLVDVTLPQSLKVISSNAFGQTPIKSINIGKGVENIGFGAFQSCLSLEEVKFEQNSELKIIEAQAFYQCLKLGNVVFPKNLTTVGNLAFYNCTALSSVSIPQSVTTLGEGAFSSCSNLIEVEFGAGINLDKIEKNVFRDSSINSIVIPGSVTSIGASSFANCKQLKQVVFEQNSALSIVNDSAFSSCEALNPVKLPQSLTVIENNAFLGCKNVFETVNGVKYVDNWAVEYDDSFNASTIVLKQNTVGIASYCFYASTISNVILNKNLKYINKYAFFNCRSLVSVKGENSVTQIGAYAFYRCTSLKEFTLNKQVTVENSAFYSVNSSILYYYMGTESDFSAYVVFDFGNNALTTETSLRYYSANNPYVLNKYWRFVNGEERVWTSYWET